METGNRIHGTGYTEQDTRNRIHGTGNKENMGIKNWLG